MQTKNSSISESNSSANSSISLLTGFKSHLKAILKMNKSTSWFMFPRVHNKEKHDLGKKKSDILCHSFEKTSHC